MPDGNCGLPRGPVGKPIPAPPPAANMPSSASYNSTIGDLARVAELFHDQRDEARVILAEIVKDMPRHLDCDIYCCESEQAYDWLLRIQALERDCRTTPPA